MKTLSLPVYGWLPDIRCVQVQTHSRCNADCLMCPWSESAHHDEPGRMADETWHLILSNLRPFTDGISKGRFCPYLMQEPLLDPTIFAKIADIYRCFPRTAVEVSTNGAALTEKVAGKLLESMRGRRHDIWISHHGIDAASMEHIMRIDYARATENAVRLLKMSDGKYTVKIRGTGSSMDGNHFWFSKEQYLAYWEKLFRDHKINRRNVTVDYFKFHDRAGTLHRTDRGANTLNMGTQRRIDPQHPFHCCRVDEWVHFMWDGKIRLCCMDYKNEIELPNITNTPLLDYFHSDEYRDLVMKVSGRTDAGPNFICARCTSPGG